MPTADTRSGGNWLPGRRAAQLELAKRWSPLVNLQKTYWKIPQTEITRLDNAILLVGDSQESFDNNASPGNRAELREAYRVLVSVMRFFKTRYFLTPPLDYRDYADLGLRPPDTIRTPHTTVNEKVAATIGPGDIREVVIHFWIEGMTHRAKPLGYDGAVIIWAILPAAPTSIDELTSHTMASRTPHALTFTEAERGQTVYIALSWQNERGNIGEWSDIQSAVIP